MVTIPSVTHGGDLGAETAAGNAHFGSLAPIV